jgi:hypothetical protein
MLTVSRPARVPYSHSFSRCNDDAMTSYRPGS